MKIPEEEQYEYLTSHLEYLNEKIIQFFTLFIKLATAIVGGVFFIHWKLPPQDVKRTSLSSAADWLFMLVTVCMILLILTHRYSWEKYRKTLSDWYPEIPNEKRIMRWLTEVVMCAVIAIACIGFIVLNPL